MSNITNLIDNHAEFHIGMSINKYAPPVITLIGTVGNLLCLFVVCHKHKKLVPPIIYMTVLATLDEIMLLVGLFTYWIFFTFYPHLITKTQCRVMFFLVNFVGNIATWTIVAMTTERFIVVVFPLRAVTICSCKKAITAIICVGITTAAKHFHYIWTAEFLYNKQTNSAMCEFVLLRKGAWVDALKWMDTTFVSFLPLITIFTFNVVMIVTIKRKQIVRKNMSQEHSGDGRQTKAVDRNRTDNGITVMLITVSLLFLILTTPLIIFRLYYTIAGKSNLSKNGIYVLSFHICHKLWYTNNAVNFYLYCLTGRRFRRQLKTIFISCRRRKVIVA